MDIIRKNKIGRKGANALTGRKKNHSLLCVCSIHFIGFRVSFVVCNQYDSINKIMKKDLNIQQVANLLKFNGFDNQMK